MGQDPLLGHARVVRFLEQAMRSSRLGHALLFLGPAGVGRETCARLLAAGLLCDEGRDALPFGCGECRGCRRVLAGAHPDVQLMLPEADAVARGLLEPEGKRQPSREIRVAQVRELNRVMRMKPYEGRARVAIIVDAHRMNASAANALLKTLEEPGPDALLVLTAPHERAVLPTISSRCQRLTFAPLPEEAVEEILRRRDVKDATARAQLADGSVAHALGLDTGRDGGSLEDVQALLRPLLEGTTEERMDAAEALGKDRRDVDSTLDTLQRVLGLELRRGVREGTGGAADPDGRRLVMEGIAALDTARVSLRENAHVQLTLEALFLATSRSQPAARSR